MADEVQQALLQPGTRNLHKRPGKVPGYGRWCMKPPDHVRPGATAAGMLVGASCDGLILERLQPAEMRAIDAFMHKSCDRIVVQVEAENGFGGREEVEALMYVFGPEATTELLDTTQDWSYTEFRRQHLPAFLQEVVKPCREQFEKDDAPVQQVMPPVPEEPQE